MSDILEKILYLPNWCRDMNLKPYQRA